MLFYVSETMSQQYTQVFSLYNICHCVTFGFSIFFLIVKTKININNMGVLRTYLIDVLFITASRRKRIKNLNNYAQSATKILFRK